MPKKMNTEEKSLAKEPDLITLVDGFIAINKQRDVDMAKTQLSEYLKEHEISPDAFEYVPHYFDAALYGKHYNHERYVNLLKICKDAYQYEQNGIPEEHAFKLSIIFSSEKDAYAYLRFYASQTFHLKKQDMKAIEAEALKTAQQRAGGDAKKQSELQELISNERKKEALRSLKKQQVTLHNACLFGLPEPQCNMDFWKKHAKEGLKDATFRSILSFAGDIEQLWQENRPKNQTIPDRQEVEKINQDIAKLKKRPGDTRAERIRLLNERYAKTSKYDVELIKLKTEQVEAVNREYKARKRNQDTRNLSPAEKEAATKELGELAGRLSHLRCELFDISAGRSLKDISMAQIIAAAEKRSSIKQGGVKDYLRKNGLSDNQIQQFLMLDRKDNDTNIPPIHIDGKSIGYDGLYLMKVPVLDDMHAARATVFGRLTHCCQSLGDVGADCVKHGVASEHGGFYVVCKGDVNHPGVEDKVLGQSWVWRSRSGAMVFDSVETNSENNKAVKQFFNQLAMTLVKKGHADKIVCGAHSGISSRMGITPLRSIKEYPVDYTKYRDSHNQRIIFDKKVPFYFYDTIEEAKKETKSFIEKALSSDTPLNNNLSFCVLLNLIKVEGNPQLQTLVEKKVNESQRKTEYKGLNEAIDNIMAGTINVAAIKEDERYYRFALSVIDKAGKSLLQKAIEQHNKNDIDYLLSHQDNEYFINSQDNDGVTALMLAIDQNDQELINTLLRNGANANIKDDNGNTALMIAIKNKNESLALFLMDNVSDINVDMDDDKGNHPIMLAAQYNLLDTLKHLLDKDAIVNVVNHDEETALIIAAKYGNTECVKALLAKEGIEVNAKNKLGYTPLIIAAEYGNIEIVNALLAKEGIEVNAKNIFGHTALMRAAEYGNIEIVNALLAKKGIEVNAKDQYGNTALIIAAKYGNIEIVNALLAKEGIEVNAINRNGHTALILAARYGKTESVNALLAKKGIEVNTKVRYGGNTALIIAAEYGNIEIVNALLAKEDIEVNAENGNGDTALILAARNGNIECVKALLAKEGIEVNADLWDKLLKNIEIKSWVMENPLGIECYSKLINRASKNKRLTPLTEAGFFSNSPENAGKVTQSVSHKGITSAGPTCSLVRSLA